MRVRATTATSVVAATVAGALAFSVFAAPAAQAAKDNLSISDVAANGGRAIVVGTTAKKSFTITSAVTEDSGIKEADLGIVHEEPSINHYWKPATCTSVGKPRYVCKATLTIDPRAEWFRNAQAGPWKVHAQAFGKDGDLYGDYYATVPVKRAARLTVDAAPEPVKKGEPLTITGKLTRADWNTNKYVNYASQSVRLEFREKGDNGYATVKTVKSNGSGALKTTVKAASDGYWRWSFTGTSTTAAITATGDYVDVR
ncbi:calcium-binding protein [Streptomyces sp. NPDC087850]|uniref:calcium-binding protein n=1 Tax=Streptomyces sp. NPDC087850 TaxID=3365809 RepID=UPI00382C0A33